MVDELSGCGFKSSCSHLNIRFRACFEHGVPWHSGNYRVWINSETRTWHDKNIQTGTDSAKTASKRVVQNIAEAAGDLIENKIANKITSAGKSKIKHKKKIVKQIKYKKLNTSKKRWQIIDYLRLF